MKPRSARIERTTNETFVVVSLTLEGKGDTQINTGIGFLDHLLTTLCFHAGFDAEISCQGDLAVDDHHTAEDCALVFGAALDRALGPREGITRFGYAYAPLDDALARCVVDLSGRPYASISLGLTRDSIGQMACENVEHVLRSLAFGARATIHAALLSGDNDHHRAEAAFKATALALRQAVALREGGIPSTKGLIG